MNYLYLILLVIGAVIIAGLGWYAWHLTRQVKALEKRRREEQAEAELYLRNKQLELVGDIRFIANSVLQQQCEITEAVLRLHYLISTLEPEVWHSHELATVRKHHEATREMPILDAYKALTKKEQFRLDNQRYALEEEHKLAVERELRWLAAYHFPSVTLIQ